MSETTQQEKTTQLASRNETTQLVSRNETTQLCTAVDRLQPPAPPVTACNRLHRLYSRIGFFYLLSRNRFKDLVKKYCTLFDFNYFNMVFLYITFNII
ncbi:hypothetical protein TNCV_2952531 [Trichonephila clavipes]|nr:hypothetical protein TNCV_2952531 [Trichonephila clavipes]